MVVAACEPDWDCTYGRDCTSQEDAKVGVLGGHTLQGAGFQHAFEGGYACVYTLLSLTAVYGHFGAGYHFHFRIRSDKRLGLIQKKRWAQIYDLPCSSRRVERVRYTDWAENGLEEDLAFDHSLCSSSWWKQGRCIATILRRRGNVVVGELR